MKFLNFLCEKTPADGSCLFHAISTSMERINPIPINTLRDIVSREIVKNDKYQKILSPADVKKYIEWIKQPSSWGGEPEIIILSDYFNLNIVVGVVETKEIIKFGESNENLLFIIYYGGHYDLAGMDFEFQNHSNEKFHLLRKKVDNVEIENLIKKFEEFIEELNKKFDFLDLKNYHIYCVDCGCMFMLESEFEEHQQKFNHSAYASIENMNFD